MIPILPQFRQSGSSKEHGPRLVEASVPVAAVSQLADIRGRITENQRRIGILQANIGVARKVLAERLVAAYRNGDADTVSTILSAGSVDGMFQAASYMRRSQQELGPRLAEVNLGNVCETRDQKRPVTVDFGEVALLAVGQHGGTDFYIGCSLQSVGDGALPVPIYMTPIHDRETPATTCTSVSQFCSKGCN